MRRKALTLVELMVAVAVSLIVLAAFYAAYTYLFKGFVRGSESTSLEIGQTLGLQVLRQDVEHAGYGLALDEPSLPLQVESEALGHKLVIRSTYDTTNKVTRGWYLVSCSGSGEPPAIEAPANSTFISTKAVYLTIDKYLASGNATVNSCPDGGYFLVYPVPDVNSPVCTKQVCAEISYYLSTTSSSNPACPDLPVLQRRVRWEGRGSSIPVLDCVADFKVRYDWNGRIVDPVTDSKVKGASAQDVRENLRLVYLYLLVRRGKYDENYTFTGSTELDGVRLELPSDPKALHYRWKVVKLAVEPMNLGE